MHTTNYRTTARRVVARGNQLILKRSFYKRIVCVFTQNLHLHKPLSRLRYIFSLIISFISLEYKNQHIHRSTLHLLAQRVTIIAPHSRRARYQLQKQAIALLIYFQFCIYSHLQKPFKLGNETHTLHWRATLNWKSTQAGKSFGFPPLVRLQRRNISDGCSNSFAQRLSTFPLLETTIARIFILRNHKMHNAILHGKRTPRSQFFERIHWKTNAHHILRHAFHILFLHPERVNRNTEQPGTMFIGYVKNTLAME